MLPLKTQKYLEVVRKRGEAGRDLEKVYRMICCKELYHIAYQNLYANNGALTPGVKPDDTVDGMSEEKINNIIENLKNRKYKWNPSRRTYILKRDGKSKRPLGMPGWNDKLVQEVIRMILEAYYEPQFRGASHGFRPTRGCHTALQEVEKRWTGVQWFIEGDIKGCFDNLDHEVILEILSRKIKDKDFLWLMKGMLKAGYVEDWKYHQTYSGTPQGGIVSPLLANVVLNELDVYVEDILIPKYTKGKARKRNKEYLYMAQKAVRVRKKGNYKESRALFKTYSKMPSVDYNDPDFRRLKYIRYADDFLLGYMGTKAEAETIKEEIGIYLKENLELKMSEEKTLITHASEDKARFLNYEITSVRNNRTMAIVEMKGVRTRERNINGLVKLLVPQDVFKKWKSRVRKDGEVVHRSELLELSDFDIINTYESELQGAINYYGLAHNVSQMWEIRHDYRKSLILTLANKFRARTTEIFGKYVRYTADNRKVMAVEIQRERKKPLRAVFGLKPIRRKKFDEEIKDTVQAIHTERSELIERLLAEACELCGKEGKVEGHHINKLKNLSKKKRELADWEKKMIAIRRKTLFVCKDCHQKIHNGEYDGEKLTKI